MRAMQSRTALGTTGRTEQFAALRYISRQMRIAADAEANAGSGRGGPPGSFAGGMNGAANLEQDAASLLAVLTLYSELLSKPDLSADEHREYSAQLKLLTDQSWELVGRFLRGSRPDAAWLGDGMNDGMPAAGSTAASDSEGPGQILLWADAELPPRRGPTSDRGVRVVVQGAAGWMAC